MKDKHQLLWTIYAIVYDVLLALKPYTDTLKEVSSILDKYNAGSILDAGCGTGNLSLFARPEMEITGVDASKKMLRIAKLKKTIFRKRLLNSEFVLASLNQKEIVHNKTFDAVVSIGSLHAVENPIETIAKLKAQMNNKGVFVLVHPLPVSTAGIIKEHILNAGFWRLLLSLLVLPLFLVSLIINLIEENLDKQNQMYFLSTQEITSMVKKAGFKIEKYSLTFGKAYTLIVGINI